MDYDERVKHYLRFLIETGGLRRYGTPDWRTPERAERIEHELGVIEHPKANFSATFVMLADVMAMVRREGIPYGPGRGSVGGCYIAWLIGVHDVDSLEFDLLFERFLNPERISHPDVDIDVSQRHRSRVLQYILDTYNRDDQVVLQVGAFVRAGGRAVVDLMFAAMAPNDPNAGATATLLKKCFPEKGSITGGAKFARELHAWLYEKKGHGDRKGFIEIAEQAGWLETLLKLDGMFTHLGKHAAGVVILRKEDLPFIPKVDVTNKDTGETFTVTGYDMYSLDALHYLKWDFLGLRTLDVVVDANGFDGGKGDLVPGNMDELLDEWREHRDDPEPYEILQDADTVGIFQMETEGYRRTLRDFQPTCFEHIVQLVALYRPGALDFEDETGRNMVEVFIDRHHGREEATYAHPAMKPILEKTHGVILYQEQQMAIARALAGFTLAEADMLRKAIGKKRPEEMAKLVPLWQAGVQKRIDDPNDPMTPAIADRVWENIEAAARYSWNRSHAVEYGIITWWCVWKKWKRLGFYAAEINSHDDRDKQANVIAEARQHVEFRPPDVNVAEDRFIVADGEIVFGLNGLKGMGDANRNMVLVNRLLTGPYVSYEDFCQRLPSLPINLKLALVACGAFDAIDSRERLMAKIPKGDKAKYVLTMECGCSQKLPKEPDNHLEVYCKKQAHSGAHGVSGEWVHEKWTVAEHINHNRTLKNPRPLPTDLGLYEFPTNTDIATGEMDAMGYYISAVPMQAINKALARHSANVIGGEVEKIKVHVDRNGGEYGRLVIITPALQRANVLIFASNWPTFGPRCGKGKQLLFRGRKDGNSFLADACWEPHDVRHHKKIKISRNGDKPTIEEFDGQLSTVQALESAGYTVRLL